MKAVISSEVTLSFDQAPQEVLSNGSVSGVLSAMFTLCLAYARAGVKPVPGVTDTEDLNADSTQFVTVPLDVMLRYHARAARAVSLYAGPSPAMWLRDKDMAERLQWVDTFRNSKETLGAVVE